MGKFYFSLADSFRFSFVLALMATWLMAGGRATAQPVISWTETTDSNWATGTNWSGSTAPGSGSLITNTDIASFNLAGTAGTIQLDFATLGATYSFGTLQFSSTATVSRTFGASSATAGVIVLNGTGANNLILDNQSATALMTISPLVGAGTGTGLSLRLNAANSTINTAGGGIFIDANITETTAGRAITKTGAGLLTLGGANTFTGGVAVSDGEFKLASLGAINTSGANALTLTATGAFSVNGFNAAISGLSGTGGTFLQNNGAANAIFTVNNTAGVSTFSGTIQDGTGGGTFALAKTGAGELALGGTNTYTGPTTLSNGTLRATNSSSFGSNTATVTATNGSILAAAGVTVSNPIIISAGAGAPTLLAGWDFQTTTTGGTAAVVAPNTPKLFNANVGSGTLYLDGTNGSSTWASTSSNPELTSFGGSNLNTAGTGMSTVTSGTTSLALANSTANGKGIVFKVDMTGKQTLTISYATQRTGTGFNDQTWEYSTDGTNWNALQSFNSTTTAVPASFAVLTLNSTSTLAGLSNAYVRLKVSGASAAGGNNRLDNIQFNAAVVNTVLLGSDITTGTATFASPITLNSAVSLSSATGGTVLFSGVIADGSAANGVTKVGGGNVILSNTNTYTGPTAITAGNFYVNGSLAAGSAVSVSGTGTLAGNGTAAGTVAVNSGGTITPGAGANTTTILNTGALTFATGGSYKWNVLTAAGSAGTGFSQISATGLNLAGLTTDNSFTIFLTTLSSSGTAGALSSFNTSTNQSWSILTSASAITGFVASRFTLNTSGFANALAGGTFTLGLGNSNQDLVLTYTSNNAITSGTIWDDNGSTPGTGNTGGLWSASKWTADAAGTTNTLPFTAGGTPTFAAGTNGTGTYTVNLDVAVNANGFNFEEGTVTIAHATGGSLTLAGPTIAVGPGASAIISESIAGTLGLVKNGTGTLTLSGTSNSYTGGNTVNDGTLVVSSASALGSTANTLILNGGTLDLKGTSVTVGALSGTGGTITSSIAGNVTFTVGDATAPAAFAGAIQNGTGTVSLVIANQSTTGVVSLSGANTFTGTTTVNSGVLSLGNLAALAGTSGITVANGAQLQLALAAGGTFLGSGVITLNGVGPVGVTNVGALILSATITSTLNNDINLATDATIHSVASATLAIGGKLTGTGALTKAGAGTLTLTGTGSTATGATFLTGGTTNASALNVLPSGPLSLAQAGTIGATLNIVESQTVGSLSSMYSGVTANLANAINISAGKTLTIAQTTSLTYGTPGVAPEAGKTSVITGAGGIALAAGSTATLTLDGTNTFTGGVTVAGGELKLNSTGAINSSGANTLAVSGTGIVTLNGFATTVSDLSGTVGATLQNANAIAATLTVNKATGASAFNGTITDGTGGGTLALTKNGAGEIALAGNNAYSGPTTLNNGTLRAGSNNALGTSAVTITNGNVFNTTGVTTSNAIIVSGTPQAVLIAGWDFQTTTTGGTAAAASPASPSVYVANFGAGNLYLDGSNGSSTWVTASTGNEVTAFAGTTNVNVGPGFGTTNAVTLALLGGATITGPPALQAANGKSIVFKFSMAGANALNVSYAAQRTASGFSSQAWSYSTDGINWTPADTITTTPTSFGTISLTSITALANAPTAYLRVTFDGATTISGNNRLDNFQFNTQQAANVVLGSDVPGATTTYTGSVTLNSAATLTAAAGGTTTFSGNILDGSSSQGIIKSGAGTVILNGINTYTGTTTVNAGVLKLDSATTLPTASAVVLQGGTLALKDGATHATTGTLTLNGSSTIAFGTPAASTILSFADSSATTWSGTLTVSGWNGSLTGGGRSQFIVGANANSLTPAQLSQINFSGYTLGANILPTGEIVPTGIVPEPGTLLGLGAAGLCFAGWLRRRRGTITP